MSIKTNEVKEIPEQTKKVAKAVFKKGNIYLKVIEELGMIFSDEEFSEMFSNTGRPAISAAKLALITIFQFVEELSDRQAADAVRSRIDWKYALGLELDDSGFDASVLSEFRSRLINCDQAKILFDKLIEKLVTAKFIKSRGRQRTDSTIVLANIHNLSRLECVSETMRYSLNSITTVDPNWMRENLESQWFERYERRAEDFNFSEEKRKQIKVQIGEDGINLLTAIDKVTTPEYIKQLPAIKILRQIWIQNYYIEEGRLKYREVGNVPAPKKMISSPYDLEARLSTKRETTWRGYKVHFTETIEENLPQLIVGVETTNALITDKESLSTVQENLAQRSLLPNIHIVDGGYMSANNIVNSKIEHQINLVGPTTPPGGWQAKEAKGFALSDFTIDWDNRRAICPNSKISSSWDDSVAPYGMQIAYIRFRKSDCSVCPNLSDCTNCKSKRRTITVNARPFQEALEQSRLYQQTPEFKSTYKARAGIEGTISQAVRVTGLRQARYRGLAKVSLQHFASASAINFLRLGRHLLGYPREQTRTSPFQALKHIAA
jgi:transposase